MPKNDIKIFLEEIINSANIGIVAISADFTIKMINVGLINIFGYKRENIENKSMMVLFSSAEYKILQKYIKNTYPLKCGASIPKYELYGIRENKTLIPLEISIIKRDKNKDLIYILIIREISKLQADVDDLKYLAYYDQLTRIPNRILFRDRTETALRQARREKDKLAILYIDIDGFKDINDTYGHEVGDRLLRELSQRFKKCIRDSDTVSRAGGDEFTILMLNITCHNDVSILAERLVKINQSAIMIDNKHIIPQISIGISIFPNDGEEIDILLNNADTAMYHAKKKGKNKFIFYKDNEIDN